MTDIIFLHGMEVSPQGTKSQFLRKHFPNCRIPDLPPDTQKRLTILDDYITQPAYLVGSSLGGLSAILFAMKKPHLVKGMVLMAPAVGFSEFISVENQEALVAQQTYIPPDIPTTVIAALHDEVIPLAAIEQMVARSPSRQNIKFIKADDDHRLNQSLDYLLSSLKSLIQAD